jgi:hypothetical protein
LSALDWLKSWTPMVIDWPKSWADGGLLAEELDPARCWHSNCCPRRPRRLVAGALVLVKDRDAATGSKRALLIAAGCVSAAFFASFFPPARRAVCRRILRRLLSCRR